jgi:hypothetical protein
MKLTNRRSPNAARMLLRAWGTPNEMAPHGILINSVAAGPSETDMLINARSLARQAILWWARSRVPTSARRSRMRWQYAVAALLIASMSRPLLAAAPLPEALQACTKEPDDTKRLACFDREAALATAHAERTIGLSPSQERKLGWPSPPLSPAPAAVGATNTPQPPPASPKKQERAPTPIVTSVVSSFSRNPDGRYVIGLANNQTWVQGEAWEAFDVKVGDTVTIMTGLFGSFHMRATSGFETRVTRAR